MSIEFTYMTFPSFKVDNRLLVHMILISVTVFYAVMLFPQVAELSPSLNDDVFQYSLCVSMKGELESGGNPIDHWVPYWSAGYPVFHHYQHLPHLMVVLAYFLLFKKVSLFFIYQLLLYLLLVCYPLIVYFSLRNLRLPMLPSAFAALFSLALSNVNGFGFELGAYIFRGSGLYNQVWAMVLFPVTMSSIYRTIDENRGYARSAFLLLLLTISQVMFGLMAMTTSLLFLLKRIDLAAFWQKVKRLSAVFVLFFIGIAYFLVPVVLDNAYFASGTYSFKEMFDSYGARYIITHFLNGDFLDSGRIPVVTVLAITGLLLSLGRRAYIYVWSGTGFILWFLLYFGRPTWGPLIDLMPLASSLQLHRFITMVHFFSAVLAGMGLSMIYQNVRKKINQTAALLLLVILICPVFWERYIFLRQNNEWLHQNKVAYLKESPVFEPMLEFIKKAPAGRTYPGRGSNWGRGFKIGRTSVMFLLGPQEIPSLGYFPHSWDLPGDFALNFREYDKSYYDLFNIRYVLAEKGRGFPPFIKEIKKSGRFRLYAVETTGYFDMVESPIAVYGDKDSTWAVTLLWLKSPMVAKKRHLSVFFDGHPRKGYAQQLLFKDKFMYWMLQGNDVRSGRISRPARQPLNIFSTEGPLGAKSLQSVSPGRVLSEKAGKNAFFCRVKADKDCFVLFKMTFHPGWHAYVDGKETEKTMLSPGFVGVKVQKGEHDLKFVYRTYKWKTPLLFAGLILIAGLFVWEKKKR